MSQEVEIGVVIEDILVLVEAAVNLGMSKLNERRMKDSAGKVHEVDHVMEDQDGRRLGVQRKKDGTVDLIPERCGDPASIEMARKLTQQYARTKVVSELKQKGYQVVKEEVQPDRSIRVVVQRWQ